MHLILLLLWLQILMILGRLIRCINLSILSNQPIAYILNCNGVNRSNYMCVIICKFFYYHILNLLIYISCRIGGWCISLSLLIYWLFVLITFISDAFLIFDSFLFIHFVLNRVNSLGGKWWTKLITYTTNWSSCR